MLRRRQLLIIIASAGLLLLMPGRAQAHVKWFTDFSFADRPRSLQDALSSPYFVALALFTFIVMGGLVLLDNRLRKAPWYQMIIQWFTSRRDQALLVLRIGTGVTMLLAWQGNNLLAPDLTPAETWIGWLQFAVALLLLFPQSTPLAGADVLVLYGIAILQYGAFYMLDYFAFVGVGVYLLVSQSRDIRIRGLRLPALYFSLGFSLMWLGLEKIIYPQWGMYLLQENPQLTLGFNHAFFLTSAAFVELALGYLLIIGLLERPMSLLITLVFFSTTLVFGRIEIIGHTILHAMLIVFLLEGPGEVYPAPIRIHKQLSWRVAFAAVNFLLLLALLIVPYSAIAEYEHDRAAEATASVADDGGPP